MPGLTRLLSFAGGGCVAAAAVWFLLAAHEGGFLPSALLSWFLPDRRDRQSFDHHLFSEHWEDVKGPFYLLVFGVALMLSADRLASAVFGG